MVKHPRRQRILRFATALAVGGSAFQLSGCDPDVRATMLTGLETTSQTLSAALITAFFQSLDDDSGTSLTTT